MVSRLLVMVGLGTALMVSRGSATPPADDDGDGWDTTTDCDDSDPAVHPAAAEDGVDVVDEDCDGTPLVRRLFISSMNSLMTAEFTLGAGVTLLSAPPDDVARLTVGAGATISLNNSIPFESGQLTVVVRVPTKTGAPSCRVTVASTSMAATNRTFSTTGTHTFTFSGVQPGDDITTLAVSCPSGAGTLTVDWLSVQNGPYVWAPINDISAQATTMGLPGMGRQAVVRASHSDSGGLGALMFVGSDVGGMAWSDDALAWTTANGRHDEWVGGGQYGVWEIWAVDEENIEEQDVVALTGAWADGTNGGLWYTDNLGAPDQSWTLVGGDLGADKHLDDCDIDGKSTASGQLIVSRPDATFGDVLLIASEAPTSRGLWWWDRTSPSTPPAQPYFAASLPDGLPSALAFDSSGDYLLVGYRTLVGASREEGALYLCPTDFDAGAGSDDCVLVSSEADSVWAGDVRDIESDPNVAGRFYVADGGRRSDGTADGCSTGESTVYAVDVSGTFPPTATIFDTDDPDDDAPSWTGGAAEYYDAEGCNDNNALGAATYGELVPPRGTASEESELASIAVDPNGQWLFAFYRLGDSKREYGCVRTFRVEIGDIEDGGTPWMPFQGWEEHRMDYHPGPTGDPNFPQSLHARTRRDHVEVEGATPSQDAFMGSEPLLEDWAGAGTHDAAFVRTGAEKPDLLLSGNFLWDIPATVALRNGWDVAWPVDGGGAPDPTATDLDEVNFALAWDGESPVFQDSSSQSIAVCPGCVQFGGGVLDLVLAAGEGDYKMARLYGKPSGASRPAADRACEAHMIGAAAEDVSIWGGDGEHAPQAWMALTGIGETHTDPTRHRGLMYLADATTDDWCWDGVQSPGMAPANYSKDAWTSPTVPGGDGLWELHCQDSSDIAADLGTSAEWWDACQQGELDNPWNLGDADVGQVTTLVALGDATAVLVAAVGLESTAHGGTDEVGEGLWLATYDATDGIGYANVELDPSELEFSVGTCDQAAFFDWEGQVAIAVDPSSDATGTVDVVLTSRQCGVTEVTFDATDPAPIAGSWEALDLGEDCSLDASVIRGASFSRDGRWLFVYGGPSGGVCALDRWHPTAGFQQVIGASELDISIQTVLGHPHLDDTFFVGGMWTEATSDPPGVYLLQRRYRPSTSSWAWGSRRLSGDDLEHRTVWDLDWGPGASPRTSAMRDLYVTSVGGGFWDLTLGRE